MRIRGNITSTHSGARSSTRHAPIMKYNNNNIPCVVLYGDETFVDSSSRAFRYRSCFGGERQTSRRPTDGQHADFGRWEQVENPHLYTRQRWTASSRCASTDQDYGGYRVDVLNLRVVARNTEAGCNIFNHNATIVIFIYCISRIVIVGCSIVVLETIVACPVVKNRWPNGSQKSCSCL